jgi:hypothetical protein
MDADGKEREKGERKGLTQAEWIWAKPPLEVFVESGKAGLKNRDGEVVLAPEWGHVEVRGNLVVARREREHLVFTRDGGSGRTEWPKDEHFFRNGKIGLMRNGKVWFDAEYDEVETWGAGFDVVYTRKGQIPQYFTGNHKPVLTEWRKFPDLAGEEEPYYVHEKQKSPTLVTMERSEAEDGQTCHFKKGIIRLDRIRKSDVLPMFAAGSQVRKENTYRLAEFDCAFTYIYSGYVARSKGRAALAKCFRDFAWMDCFGSTWQRLILVSVSPQRRKPLDVRVLVRGLKDVPEWEPTGDFALGFDESLAEDEVKVFMVQYFADHWPSWAEDSRWDAVGSYIPSRIKREEEAWRRYVDDPANFTSAEGQAAYLLEASVPPAPSECVPKGRSWRNIERTCRMLVERGASLEDFAWRICDSGWSCSVEKDIAAVADNTQRLLEWGVEHGSNPNHVELGSTCLDVLDEIIEREENSPPERRQQECLKLAFRLRDVVLAAGGKRRAEILADRTPVWLEMPKEEAGNTQERSK